MTDQQARRGRWADDKPRCPDCMIVLVGGAPPSACWRRGCEFQAGTGPERRADRAGSLTGSSLVGEDFSIVEGKL